ncbi:hypothetical protein [Listeria cornellensis]|uniref:Uncharacterized protein n=1 Tax=Listeria cornellensis FSL F6-0969 TaxID=1265820 RepID=W7BHP1_9LIST|nr:hypothetical protein [Listeria cornellensis]EUJ25407.1 hypothetical protein PCORN_17169 [Listeria cornellensis FSL F6-0969]
MSIKKKLQLSLAAGATVFAFSAAPLLGTIDSTSTKVEASQLSYLTDLDIATSGDNYVVSYTLANVTPSGTVHLNIINQRGQQIKSIGAINKPQKKGNIHICNRSISV